MVSKVVDSGSTEFVIALEPKPEWDAYVDGELKDCSDPAEGMLRSVWTSDRRTRCLDGI